MCYETSIVVVKYGFHKNLKRATLETKWRIRNNLVNDKKPSLYRKSHLLASELCNTDIKHSHISLNSWFWHPLKHALIMLIVHVHASHPASKTLIKCEEVCHSCSTTFCQYYYGLFRYYNFLPLWLVVLSHPISSLCHTLHV